MKVGDLVKFDTQIYPRLDGKLGVLREHRDGNKNQWEVFIDGRIHPYFVRVEDIELINESR